MKYFNYLLAMLLFLLPVSSQAAEYPFTFNDSAEKTITLQKQPQRVVSLVPSVTEMLLRIGVDEAVTGITYHSTLPPQTDGKEIIGGFFRPNLDRVAACKPDVIFYADLQKDIPDRFAEQASLIQLTARSIEESFDHIRLLGRIFDRTIKAEEIIAEEKRQLSVIQDKIAGIPQEQKQRVMRLMGRDSLMAPGDNSFQNEYIQAAGGIAPEFGKTGNIISVSLEEWQKFNPQVLYGCGGDRQIQDFLEQSGWNEVDAVRNKRIFFFPCDLTCRASTHAGYFVSWLAARIYGKEFGDPADFILPEQVVDRKSLQISLSLDYIKKAEIIESDIKDFRNKTVALHFSRPMTVVSTLEGQRSGITSVANHYFPPPSWGLGHKQGLEALRQSTLKVLDIDPATTAMLFTGANMDNLAVVKQSFKEMEVYALVTAGVLSNAVRMSVDAGRFYEPDSTGKNKKPGTINVLLLTNMQLTPRAMTRAIISATEAKSAALQDLDIRSSYSPVVNQATGTGTDNIIVVEGAGLRIDSSGGHSKMGELIARAVYEGVQQAVHLQNGVTTGRSIFQRLKERRINLYALCNNYTSPVNGSVLQKQIETLLLDPKYANFLKAIMAISDDFEKGLITDLDSLDSWCLTVAGQIAGVNVTEIKEVENMPRVLSRGLGALLTGAGIAVRNKK